MRAIEPDENQACGFMGTLADPRRNALGWRVLDRLDDNSSTCLLRQWTAQGKRSLFATDVIYTGRLRAASSFLAVVKLALFGGGKMLGRRHTVVG
jgi:hypothetical protein